MSESQGPNTGAFAETWRKLWDLHNSDLHLLEKENQKLRQKLGLSEEELTERHLTERKPPETVERLRTQSISSDEPQRRISTLQHQPKSAWARVVPQQPSENDLFHTVQHTERAVEEGCGKFFSGCFWTHVEKLVSNPMFDVAAAACIFLNAIVMACEAQWEGLSVGANLSYSTLNQRHVAAWTSAEPAFVVLGYVFGVLFTLELILKIMGQRGQFCLPETQSQSAQKNRRKNMKSVWTNQKSGRDTHRNSVLNQLCLFIPDRSLLRNSATLSSIILMQRQLWNWIDASIILTWLFSVASGNASLPVDPTLLRVARLARLLRTFDSKCPVFISSTGCCQCNWFRSEVFWKCFTLFEAWDLNS